MKPRERKAITRAIDNLTRHTRDARSIAELNSYQSRSNALRALLKSAER